MWQTKGEANGKYSSKGAVELVRERCVEKDTVEREREKWWRLCSSDIQYFTSTPALLEFVIIINCFSNFTNLTGSFTLFTTT